MVTSNGTSRVPPMHIGDLKLRGIASARLTIVGCTLRDGPRHLDLLQREVAECYVLLPLASVSLRDDVLALTLA